MGLRKTKIPSIPDPTPENLLAVVKALKEVTEVAEMKRGDKLDAKVTYRDLIDGGLAAAGSGLSGGGGAGGNTLGDPSDRNTPGPNSPFLKPPSWKGLVLPGRPANVHTIAVWDGIQVMWDWPESQTDKTYWKRAIIWVSPTSSFDNASIAGYSTVNHFTQRNVGLSAFEVIGTVTQPGERWYWVAWEGLYNEATQATDRSESTPYQWEAGIYGKTAVDPDYALEILTGQVTEAILSLGLSDRIDLIDYDPENPDTPFTTSVQERILSASVSEDGIYAAIAERARTDTNTSEGKTYATGDWSLRIATSISPHDPPMVAGFGLSVMSTLDTTTGQRSSSSAFVVQADKFAVVGRIPYDVHNPWTTGKNTAPQVPFIIDTVTNTVGINGDLIVTGSITADSIQARSIGAQQINVQDLIADIVTSEIVMAGQFMTDAPNNFRVEINGQGGPYDQYPLWIGRNTTGGSGSLFYILAEEGYASLKMGGELFITGAGKFFGGNSANGEQRIEIGGPDDTFVLWAGTGQKTADNSVFYIDETGKAVFKGTVEAKYVSGEISRTAVINDRGAVTTIAAPVANDTFKVSDLEEKYWKQAGPNYHLPESPFQPHRPFITISFNMYGLRQKGGAARVQWLPTLGSTIWQTLVQSAFSNLPYGQTHTLCASAPVKTGVESVFRLQVSGFDGSWVTCSERNGIAMGIR